MFNKSFNSVSTNNLINSNNFTQKTYNKYREYQNSQINRYQHKLKTSDPKNYLKFLYFLNKNSVKVINHTHFV